MKPFTPNDAVNAHRPRDILDLLFTHIPEREVELVAHLVAHDPTDANPARLGQRFESSGDIDAIAEDVALVDDYVTKIDAYAKIDPPFGGDTDVALDHLALDLNRAAHRVDDACKF